MPPGELADAGLFGPEFQIENESTVVSTANDLTLRTNNYVGNPTNDDTTVAIDLSPLVALAATPSSLVAALDHDLMYGGMSDAMTSTLTDMVAALPANNPTGRVTGALQVLLASPEFAIQKMNRLTGARHETPRFPPQHRLQQRRLLDRQRTALAARHDRRGARRAVGLPCVSAR